MKKLTKKQIAKAKTVYGTEEKARKEIYDNYDEVVKLLESEIADGYTDKSEIETPREVTRNHKCGTANKDDGSDKELPQTWLVDPDFLNVVWDNVTFTLYTATSQAGKDYSICLIRINGEKTFRVYYADDMATIFRHDKVEGAIRGSRTTAYSFNNIKFEYMRNKAFRVTMQDELLFDCVGQSVGFFTYNPRYKQVSFAEKNLVQFEL